MALQSASITPSSGSSATLDYPSDTKVGSLLTTFVFGDAALNSSTGIIDSLSNIWLRAAFIAQGIEEASIWYTISKGGPCTVTFTWNSAITFATCSIAEHPGIKQSNPLRQTNTNNNVNTGATTDSATTGVVNTLTEGELILAGFARYDGSGTTAAVGTGFTLIQDPFGDSPFMERVQKTAGPIAGTLTPQAADDDFVAIIATFEKIKITNNLVQNIRPRCTAPGICR
jgi:hypothetical protein